MEAGMQIGRCKALKELKYSCHASIPPMGTPLCTPRKIEPGKAKVFSFGKGNQSFEMFVVRKPKNVFLPDRCQGLDGLFAYVNKCPHTYSPLDWKPGTFFNSTNEALQCSTHGALFRIYDGFCFSGPCNGKYLEPINIFLKKGFVCVGKIVLSAY